MRGVHFSLTLLTCYRTKFRGFLGEALTSQRDADRVLRQWAGQCGWLRPPPAAADTTTAMHNEIVTLQQELAALREQLRALNARLEDQCKAPRTTGEEPG